jgi:hypothetical protein
VFDPKEDSITLARHRQQDALRELEMEWTKQKRPQDVSCLVLTPLASLHSRTITG